MANHGARQQKKLAKQKAKRTEKRTQLTRQSSQDPTVRLQGISRRPIVGAFVPETMWDMGIGMVFIARGMPDGRIAWANFLIDTYCLGVKDATWNISVPGEFDAVVDHIRQGSPLKAVAPEYIAKLVRDAVAYATSLGFAPHPDFRAARLLLEGIDPTLCSEQFKFGKNGTPFYIQGPHDSMERARMIVLQLQNQGGRFIVGGDHPHGLLNADEREALLEHDDGEDD